MQMLIIAGSLDVNVKKFIELIKESTCEFEALAYNEWYQGEDTPDGFVYIKVMPEISFKRLAAINESITLKEVQLKDEHLNNYFIHKTIMKDIYRSIPVLILNGFVDFETDLSQFYNHLFHIKKFFNKIHGKEETKHRNCGC